MVKQLVLLYLIFSSALRLQNLLEGTITQAEDSTMKCGENFSNFPRCKPSVIVANVPTLFE